MLFVRSFGASFIINTLLYRAVHLKSWSDALHASSNLSFRISWFIQFMSIEDSSAVNSVVGALPLLKYNLFRTECITHAIGVWIKHASAHTGIHIKPQLMFTILLTILVKLCLWNARNMDLSIVHRLFHISDTSMSQTATLCNQQTFFLPCKSTVHSGACGWRLYRRLVYQNMVMFSKLYAVEFVIRTCIRPERANVYLRNCVKSSIIVPLAIALPTTYTCVTRNHIQRDLLWVNNFMFVPCGLVLLYERNSILNQANTWMLKAIVAMILSQYSNSRIITASVLGSLMYIATAPKEISNTGVQNMFNAYVKIMK